MADIGQLPEITDIQRLALKPGDRLIVRTDEKLSDQTAAALRTRLHSWLGIPDDVRILILDRGVSIEVIEGDV
jgi:hypothetical protein